MSNPQDTTAQDPAAASQDRTETKPPWLRDAEMFAAEYRGQAGIDRWAQLVPEERAYVNMRLATATVLGLGALYKRLYAVGERVELGTQALDAVASMMYDELNEPEETPAPAQPEQPAKKGKGKSGDDKPKPESKRRQVPLPPDEQVQVVGEATTEPGAHFDHPVAE